MTPPQTPTQTPDAAAVKEYFEEPTSTVVIDEPGVRCKSRFFAGLALFVAAAIVYSRNCCLHTELSELMARITKLEQENLQMKAAIERLSLNYPAAIENYPETLTQPDVEIASDDPPKNPSVTFYQDRDVAPPKTKTVWLGNEEEDKVKILDKKQILPEYCYFNSDEDDLFYEYNMELCENKLKKLEAKAKKGSRDVENQKLFDEYVSETLKSLNDEVQDIKLKRSIDDPQSPPKSPKKVKEKRDKKKLKRQAAVDSEDWAEKRTSGREEARKSQEKKQDVNWYLKRKNEREINRLESGSSSPEM